MRASHHPLVGLLIGVIASFAQAQPCTQAAPANRCIPSGGPKRTDCYVEWATAAVPALRKNGIPRNVLRCWEGDPRCDSDGDLNNKSCSIRTTLCINNHDPRLDTCVASDVNTAEIQQPNPNSLEATDTTNVTTLESQIGAGGFGVTTARHGFINYSGVPNATQDLCSAEFGLLVPLRQTAQGTVKPASRRFKLRSATSLSGLDSDVLQLQCVPSTCGNHIVEADHETCDDGNRDNHDGCDQGCQIEPPSPTPTATSLQGPPTATLTIAPAASPTDTATATATPTVTNSPAATATTTTATTTATAPAMPTPTPSTSPTRTTTASRTPTPTQTQTRTGSGTPTQTPTATIPATATATLSATVTNTNGPTDTPTLSPTPTSTATVTDTALPPPPASATPTASPTNTRAPLGTLNFTVATGSNSLCPADSAAGSFMKIQGQPSGGVAGTVCTATRGNFTAGPIVLSGGSPGANGIATLSIASAVVIDAQQPSQASNNHVCWRIEGNGNGTIDCDGGSNADAKVTLSSNTTSAPPAPLWDNSWLSYPANPATNSGNGAAVIPVAIKAQTTSGACPGAADSSWSGVNAITTVAVTGSATATVNTARKCPGGNGLTGTCPNAPYTVTLQGTNFNCSNWTTDSGARLVIPKADLDADFGSAAGATFGVGDLATVARFND